MKIESITLEQAENGTSVLIFKLENNRYQQVSIEPNELLRKVRNIKAFPRKNPYDKTDDSRQLLVFDIGDDKHVSIVVDLNDTPQYLGRLIYLTFDELESSAK